MPLDGKQLGKQIWALLKDHSGGNEAVSGEEMWGKIGEEIVRHIKTQGEVKVAGVKPGPSTIVGKIE